MFITGIAGGTCAGKTTLAARLGGLLAEYSDDSLRANAGMRQIKVETLHMDKYFKNPTPTTAAPVTGIVYPEHNHPDSFELERFYADFGALAAGDADVLIVEGLLILHLAEIRERLDLKIFVDLPSDERLFRRIQRFTRERKQTPEEVAARYLDTVRYRHAEFVEPSRWHADLVVNGGFGSERAAGFIADLIISKIKAADNLTI